MRSYAVLTFMLFALPAAAEGFSGNGLDVLTPLVGKTFVGEDVNASGEKTVSVDKWEWILGANAVRMTASVNDGELGYQLTFYVDPTTHVLSFDRVLTNGAHTVGTVKIINRQMVWKEKVAGTPDVDLVQITFTLLPDGKMKSASEYFKGKKPAVGGHEFQYHVDLNAKQIFASNAK